ncbi:PTS system mannose/fructose/N-acetylgalactosamine-transporter subunit IIB [Alicyclobacillus kakegawensis]|uniref:PTS system mannose/fructose/N-acetylgalactosamine-transporter subunit IIB n=1 Tax=Alicyclobacillus kakegawensis TaxID=392012 RepID=UPI00082A52FF|nr:PTS sugar transporter subunit IIB [Alicyclobacillus kakegawensis]
MSGQQSLFVRVDDRLIHGQVVTTWVRSLGVRTIWVMSDRAANEPIEVVLLKSSVPSHLDLEVFTVEQTVDAWQRRRPSGPVLLLAEFLQDVLYLCERGVNIDQINLGGMRYKPGYAALSKAVYVGEAEAAALQALEARGVEAYIRVVPSDTKVDAYERLRQRWH